MNINQAAINESLYWAIFNNDRRLVKLALSEGADIYYTREIFAAGGNVTMLEYAFFKDRPGIVSKIIDHKRKYNL